MKRDDGKAALAAIARAFEADILASTGVNIRGTSGDGAVRELEDAGVSEGTARSAVKILSECEDARFSPSGVSQETAQSLWKRTKEAMGAIGAHGKGKTSVPPPSGSGSR